MAERVRIMIKKTIDLNNLPKQKRRGKIQIAWHLCNNQKVHFQYGNIRSMLFVTYKNKSQITVRYKNTTIDMIHASLTLMRRRFRDLIMEDLEECAYNILRLREAVKYPKQLKNYSFQSNKLILCKCRSCGFEIKKPVAKLYSRGFRCSRCNKLRSFNERLFKEYLLRNNIVHQEQHIFQNTNRAFDFFLPTYNLCVELHGKQHYTPDTSFGKNAYTNSIKSDGERKNIAKKEKISLIEINCSSGEPLKIIEEINNKLYSYDLPICNHLDLSFLEIRDSNIKKMYLSGLSANKIGKSLGMSKTTVLKKLRGLNIPRRSPNKQIINLNTKIAFNSLKEPKLLWGVSDSNICFCLRGRTQTAGRLPRTGEKLEWMYYDEYIKCYGYDNVSFFKK
jgi:hypothetical protein